MKRCPGALGRKPEMTKEDPLDSVQDEILELFDEEFLPNSTATSNLVSS